MNDEAALSAAEYCLNKARTGGEGPLVDAACYVATNSDGEPCGAALVRLEPDVDLSQSFDTQWSDAPPDAVQQGLGRPHLTWIFVPPLLARHGIGTELLHHSINALLNLGYRQLSSTFWLGNESSALWHWMNGFRLVNCIASPRAINRKIAAKAVKV
jgi:hypothetical protein